MTSAYNLATDKTLIFEHGCFNGIESVTTNSVKPEETLNHTIVGVKFLVLLVILGLGFKNLKKSELSRNIWLLMIGLTVFNIVIASAR